MYSIRVTALEKFRRYLTEASPFDTEAALLATLSGEFKGNDKTEFGTAYHNLIEGHYTHENGLYKVGDFLFNEDQARPGIEFKKQHPVMMHESTHTQVYHTKYFPIQVTGHTDGIDGAQVRDTKTKFRSPSVQEYMDSCQWRYYLDMLNLDEFYYDIFEVRGFDQLPAYPPYQLDVQIIRHEPIHCLRYEHMHEELVSHLNLFLDYLHNRNILHLLKPAIENDYPF